MRTLITRLAVSLAGISLSVTALNLPSSAPAENVGNPSATAAMAPASTARQAKWFGSWAASPAWGMPEERVIVIQEAAYPSGALPPESARGATPDNQKRFVQRLIASGAPFVYGFAFDSWFARESSPPGGFGGLWDDQRRPKPVVAALDLGPYAGGPGAPG